MNMKAIVVGGTKGFGIEVVKELIARGYEVVRTGRSDGDFNVDVGDEEKWMAALGEIKRAHEKFNLAIFISGFARASDPNKRTEKDWEEHRKKNVDYVESALNELRFTPKATIITIGSQWSYKKGAKEIEPYIQSKHQLRELTARFAMDHPDYSVAHVAVPPMKTPQRELVWEAFGEKPEQQGQTVVEVADPAVIAKSLVEELVENERHGDLIQIGSQGERRIIAEKEHPKENLWPRR